MPITSAARRAAVSLAFASRVGTSTLPPMWPHFFTDASWSSKWTPAAPASIIDFISSNALSTPPKPASASATIGAKIVDLVLAFGPLDLVGAREGVVDALDDRRHRVHRIERLVRVHLAGDVGVARDLPAREVDRLQAGLDLLHRLVAGERAERVDEGLGVDQVPELLGAASRQRVLDANRAGETDDVAAEYVRRMPFQRGFWAQSCSRARICSSRVGVCMKFS